MKLAKSNLLPEYAAVLTTQEYGAKPRIQGVELKEGKSFISDDGLFCELLRITDGQLELWPEFEPRQISYSEVEPGAKKAFHLQFDQEDVWMVPPDKRMLVVLHDARHDSSTAKVTMRLVLGGGKAQALLIPRGVAHGCANIWTEPSSLIYATNAQFNAAEPDEHRLPWDFLGEDVWQMTKG